MMFKNVIFYVNTKYLIIYMLQQLFLTVRWSNNVPGISSALTAFINVWINNLNSARVFF